MGLFPSFPIRFAIRTGTFQKLSKSTLDAYEAPFPTKKHKGGAKAFPQLLPNKASDEGAARMKKARTVLANWGKPALVLFSDKDPVLSSFQHFFYDLIPTSSEQAKITIHGAGHFLQEDKGEEIGQIIDQFMKNELLQSPSVN